MSMTTAPLHLRPLWLTEHYHPSAGGMAWSCDRIVHGLRGAGVEVDVAHLSRRAEGVTVTPRRRGRDIVCGLGQDPAHALNCLWNMLAADPLRGRLTHLVAFGGQLPLMAGPVYASWLGLPLVTLLRGNDFDIGVFTPGREATLREALRRSARVGVVSRDHEWKVGALHPGVEVTWVPNGLDVTEWEALPSQRAQAAAWRRETVAPGRRVLGLFGQIKPKKGGLVLLEALLASGQAARFHLLLVGEIDEAIHAWLVGHEGELAYTLLPFVERQLLPPYYLACDLVALPSLYDGLPNVLLEAAGLGVPPLASTAGGMADVLRDGEHGFLFAPGDLEGCRMALNRAALADDAELRQLGVACEALVRTELTAELETARYLDLLRATVGAGVGGR
jgi:glycogen(starch) synthase